MDDLTHNASRRLDRREVAELLRLHFDVIADHSGDGGGVRARAGPLAVNALVDGLELVGAVVADIEAGTATVRSEHDAAVVLERNNRRLHRN